MKDVKSPSYGVMAIHTLAGLNPECDEVFFDGWYLHQSDAEEIFDLFKKRYPNANVFLVDVIKDEWRGMQLILPKEKRKAKLDSYNEICDRTGT